MIITVLYHKHRQINKGTNLGTNLFLYLLSIIIIIKQSLQNIIQQKVRENHNTIDKKHNLTLPIKSDTIIL